MTVANYPTAVDTIYSRLLDAMPAIADIVGYTPEIRFQGVVEEQPPKANEFFLRARVEPVNETQATFRNSQDKRYQADGLVIIQLFSPMNIVGGIDTLRQVADLIKKAYRGSISGSGIWYYNTIILEIPPDRHWNRLNIRSEYEYSEIG